MFVAYPFTFIEVPDYNMVNEGLKEKVRARETRLCSLICV